MRETLSVIFSGPGNCRPDFSVESGYQLGNLGLPGEQMEGNPRGCQLPDLSCQVMETCKDSLAEGQ